MPRPSRFPSHGQGGFTLVELIIVIVVIGLLAAMALPKYGTLASEAEKATSQYQTVATDSQQACRETMTGAGKSEAEANTICGDGAQTIGGQ